MNTILEMGGKGGIFHLTESNGKFQYATNEAAALDMLDEEEVLEIKALLAAKNTFDIFESAMDSLLNKYPVFRLYPLFVHPEYKKHILVYYKKYLQNSDEERNWNRNNWEEMLISDKS